MKQNYSDIDKILANFCAQDISKEDNCILKEFITASDVNKQYAKNYIASFKKAELAVLNSSLNKKQSWDSIEEKLSEKKRTLPNNKMWLGIAASIALMISTVWMFLFVNKIEDADIVVQTEHIVSGKPSATLILANGNTVDLEKIGESLVAEQAGKVIRKNTSNGISYNTDNRKTEEEIFNTLDIPLGGEYHLTLSDGTEVWLNSESKLTYPVSFITNKREVNLEGEAYFKVAHNKNIPFFVNIGANSVKVLGTEFNVSNYNTNTNSVITLVNGSVKVYSPVDSLTIAPDTQALIQNNTSLISSRQVDSKIYCAWVNGVFEFENESLEHICTNLGRWYDVDFVFADEKVKELHFTGAAKKQKSIGYILKILEETMNVEFDVSQRTITVKISK